jgi:sugar-specific transcriptional regulator TrmB
METEKQIEYLVRLGLTPNCSKVYLSLIQSGPASVKEISKDTGIAIQDVYRLVPILEAAGFVERIIDLPLKFEAISMEKTIDYLLKKNEEKQQELQKEARVFLQESTSRSNKKPRESIDRYLLVLSRGVGLLQKSKIDLNQVNNSSFFLLTFDLLVESLSIFEKEIENGLERGVKFLFVIKVESKDLNSRLLESSQFQALFKANPGSQARFTTESIEAVVWIGDDKKAAIALGVSRKFSDNPWFRTNNPVFVSLASQYFENKWKNSKSLTEIKKRAIS